MLASVPLHNFKDFKPDVVICPQCTQRLMSVRDIRWSPDKVELSYGCDTCGNELDKTIAEDAPIESLHPAQPPATSLCDNPEVDPEDADGADVAVFPFKSSPAPSLPAGQQTSTISEQPSYKPRQAFIEDRAARTPRQVFDQPAKPAPAATAPEQSDERPVRASRASMLLRDVAIFNL